MNTLANIIREVDKFQRGKIYKHFPQSVLDNFSEYLRGTFQASALQSTKYNSAKDRPKDQTLSFLLLHGMFLPE